MTDFALTYVEIDVPYCALLYGTTNGAGTCPAVLGVDSDVKCWNTIATCAVPASFTNVPVTLRFAMETGSNPDDIEAIPNLTDVSITAGRISLGEDLGQRESVSLSFKDHPYSDTGPGFDKYLGDRTYDPYSQGSFWGKFRARQPYLKGRPVRLYRGFVGQALADMECRHYIVDSYTGPGVDGRYTLIAKDILKLLDGDQAQAPALNKGSLAADITSGASSATLAPTGIGNTDYATSGKLAIGGGEIVSFTRSGDTLTLTGRGLNGTTAMAHTASDRVQECLEYSGADPADIVADLMDRGGIDSSYIPIDDWHVETDTFNRRLYTGIVADPTPIRTLINEIIVQAGLAIWWDPVEQKVFLQALRAVTPDAKTFDESNIITGSFVEQPEKRVSQVWVYYGQRNPLAQQDLPSNYRSTVIEDDAAAEDNYGSPAIQTIDSRWIAFGGLTTAERIGSLQLGRYVDAPRKFTFEVLKGPSVTAPILGAGYYIEHEKLQSADGSRVAVPIQITRIRSDADRWAMEAEENIFVSYDSTDTLSIVIDANSRNLNLRSIYDSLYTAPVTNDEITFFVNSLVVVGSNSSSIPAIDVGTWPSATTTGNRTSGSPTLASIADTSTYQIGMIVKGTGIPAGAKIISKTSTSITLDANATSGSSTSTTLTVFLVKLILDISGRLQGKGGNGGQGARGPAGIPGAGEAGGTALYTRYGITVVMETGSKVFGGGGGGGGAGTRVYNNHAGGGGGGGAGDVAGNGGAPGNNAPAQAGGAGSLDTPGGGGYSWTTNGSLFGQPGPYPLYGGNGGAPGSAGSSGGSSDSAGGAGGPAGNAIDGLSYTDLTNSGTLAGPQVN